MPRTRLSDLVDQARRRRRRNGGLLFAAGLAVGYALAEVLSPVIEHDVAACDECADAKRLVGVELVSSPSVFTADLERALVHMHGVLFTAPLTIEPPLISDGRTDTAAVGDLLTDWLEHHYGVGLSSDQAEHLGKAAVGIVNAVRGDVTDPAVES